MGLCSTIICRSQPLTSFDCIMGQSEDLWESLVAHLIWWGMYGVELQHSRSLLSRLQQVLIGVSAANGAEPDRLVHRM